MPGKGIPIDASTAEQIAVVVVRKAMFQCLVFFVVVAVFAYWERDRIINAAKDAVLSKMESKFGPIIDQDKKRLPWLFAPESIGQPLEYVPVD